jgi:kelch-like protein 2/3
MLCRRGTLGVGILNDKVYAVGGFDGMTGLVSVECWSMKPNESWTMVAPLSTRRSSVGIAVVNNYLYASINTHIVIEFK